MKDLAPEIIRRRLVIEGFFNIHVDKKTIEDFFRNITDYLDLKMYGKPIIFSPEGKGKDINQGYDAFVPLIDSGISLYVWSAANFLSLILYSCKDFDEQNAIEITKKFFGIKEIESFSF